ncbi:hypothetical protein [Rhodospirillum sp. A1_3_36]|uniref:hypothetical protein n=1 Tax=Rhodospirillum sp. A1_3_36 TaxID=3391666 RepID=UPI0039A52BC1
MNTFTGITFAPIPPTPLLWALLGLGLLIGGYALFRRARGSALRCLPLAALLIALTNPQWVTEKREPVSDVAVVVVDESLSQKLGGRIEETREAAQALKATLDRLPGLETRLVTVDGNAQGTRLTEAAREALVDVPRSRRAGVILVTDGQVHDVQRAEGGLAFDPGAPVHALLTGQKDATDRLLVVNQAPSYGLVGRDVSLSVTLEDPEVEAGTPVFLSLSRDGEPPREVVVPANRPTTLPLPVDHAGANVFDLSAPSREGEVSTLNNRVALSVNGVRDRLRVLLISGQPHAGERTWRNLLKADPAVDLVHFTILRPPLKEDLTPLSELALIAFPIQELFEEKLSDFDLIIFDRYARRGLVPESYLANVARYVEQGGALLLSVGPEYTEPYTLADSALASVLPASPTGAVDRGVFTPRLAKDGARHPVTANLPQGGDTPTWGPWLRQVALGQSRGHTLLTGLNGLPLLTLDRVGEGRVALLASDTIWLWSKGWRGGGPQGELLRRLAHWLMKEPELEEESLSAKVEDDRITVSTRTLGDPPDQVTVTAPDGTERTTRLGVQGPGRAGVTLPASLPGLYTVTTPDGQRSFTVSGPPNPLESTRLAPTAELLAPLMTATGGGAHWLSDGQPAIRRTLPGQSTNGSDWMGLRANGEHVVSGVTLTPVLPLPLALTLILGGLALAWWREGR